MGFMPREFSKRFGRRVSAYAGYIRPFLRTRRNLRVIAKSEVRRILGSSKQHSKSRKEIIISAGVIGSPLLLMRSGVGPRDVLDEAQVPIVKELPVGKGIHDHVVISLTFVINNKSLVFDPDRDLNPGTLQIYNAFGDEQGNVKIWKICMNFSIGPYSTSGGYVGQAMLASSVTQNEGKPTWPDTMLYPVQSASAPAVVRPAEGIAMADWETPVFCGIVLTRPKSRGTLTLNATNVDGDPVIDFNFLSHPQDIQVLLEGIQTALKIYEETPAYKRLEARLAPIEMPACDNLEYRSEEFWSVFIRQRGNSFLHAVGTCRMGRGQSDPDAVVDSRL
ncbi:Glucose dehydrogenase [FAD, quinone], partial [Orchesella cincta]